jgi:hypothetical protein
MVMQEVELPRTLGRFLHAGDPARLGFETRKEQSMATLKQDTAPEQRLMNRTIFAKAGAISKASFGCDMKWGKRRGSSSGHRSIMGASVGCSRTPWAS